MQGKHHCLNCDEPISKKFCPNCGQKTDIHRITIKHFIFHDLLHGVWHLEKGILFTLKEAIVRPGNAALDYIGGKRVRYYNVFYLILLLIGLGIIIENMYAIASQKYVSFIKPEIETEAKSAVLDYIGKNVKFFLALAIPVFSLNSYLLFNKKKLYYSEHIIIFGMMYLGIIFLTLVSNIFYFVEFIKPIAFLSYWIDKMLYVIFFYIAYGLYKAFGSDYSKLNFTFRILIYLSFIFIELRLMGELLKIFLLKN